MQADHGLTIDTVRPGSLADKSGLLPGDVLFSVNSHRLRDMIDFLFYSADDDLVIIVKRDGNTLHIPVSRKDEREFGLDFRPSKVMTCKNNCIFCFVKQLPAGLRKTLYIKDEDYRMSFLYGNYVTLSSLTADQKKRIVEQRLSPLYISVHSTNRSVRNRLLGNPKAPDIIRELKFLADNKIRFNAQIVLCPDYNDGKDLQQTIGSLYKFYPYVLSVAVVPVGLTLYRKNTIRPVEKGDAVNALDTIELFQKRFMKKHGNPIVYGADELYLKAQRPFPPVREYGELHQIENGVGMIPLFLNQLKRVKMPKAIQSGKKLLTFCGISFYPFLKKSIEKLFRKENFIIDVIPVENKFFGSSVTVTGLLTGRDVIRTMLDRVENHEMILMPDVVLNGEDKFLDDISLCDVEETVHLPVKKIRSDPEGLIRGITE